MSDKSIWQGVGEAIGGLIAGKTKPKALTTIEQRCPVCANALDPRWTECPYCKAAKNASARSSRVVPEPPKASGRDRTRVDVQPAPPQAGAADVSMAAAGGAARGRTIVESPSGGALGVERHAGGGRRLTGIVTSFTWSRLGQLFEVRDGRNYAGSGLVSADNNSPCDILVAEDRTMSSAHFLILCQGTKYIISDNLSTNGTFVNGVQVDARGIDLEDDAVIKVGATVFRFQKIHAQLGASTDPGPQDDRGWRPGREDTVA